MKNQLKKNAAICFAALIACPCVMAYEKFDLDMVKIPEKNFEMLRTKVTQELYKSVMDENPSWFCCDNEYLSEIEDQKENTSNYPVENVSWYDVIYFCNKLSKKKGLQSVYAVDGETNIYKWDYEPHNKDIIHGEITQNIFANGYRLPTVEEWLYAVKFSEYYAYSEIDDIDKVAYYDNNSNDDDIFTDHKKFNGHGLYDMIVNVLYEWCWDSNGGYERIVCGSVRSAATECNGNSCIGFRIVRSTGK